MKYFDVKKDEMLRQEVKDERNRLINTVINHQLNKPTEDKDNNSKLNKNERVTLKRGFPMWVPVNLTNCTTISRGLYHNGQSLHTCTTNGCCK